MNMPSLDEGRGPAPHRHWVMNAVSLAASLLAGAGRRVTWLTANAVKQAIPGVAGGQASYNGRQDGPPDLDELWRDFNRKLSGVFTGN